MRRFLAIALLALCAAVVDARQLPQSANLRDQVSALLRSADPREQAWGAWLAERNLMRDMIPLLLEAVQHRVAQGRAPDAAALDALIQLHADVPEPLLRDILPMSEAPALILLSQSRHESNELLLEIVAQKNGTPWFAAGNLLLARKAPEFVLHLLSTLKVSLTVTISEHGNAGVGFGGGFGMAIGCGAIGSAPGYPPLAAYQLSHFASPGSVVLSTGPTPVYYRRVVSEAGMASAASSQFRPGPSIKERLEYIAVALHESPERLPLRASYHESLKRSDSLSAALVRLRQDIEWRYAMLVRTLIEGGVISAGQASTLPELAIDVEVHQVK